jgi:hypothetical protein
MNTSSFFPKSLPKCPVVARAPNEALSFAEDFRKAIIKLIKTKTITTLGTVTPGFTTLQYLFDPTIHHNLSGALTTSSATHATKRANSASLKLR